MAAAVPVQGVKGRGPPPSESALLFIYWVLNIVIAATMFPSAPCMLVPVSPPSGCFHYKDEDGERSGGTALPEEVVGSAPESAPHHCSQNSSTLTPTGIHHPPHSTDQEAGLKALKLALNTQ